MKKLNKRLIIIVTAVFLVRKTKEDLNFTKEDLRVIETLGTSLNVKNFAFVQSQRNLKIKDTIKNFSKNTLFSVVIDVDSLERIIENRTSTVDYFRRTTMIIVKENLNVVTLLQKVSGLHLLYWTVFTDSFDVIKDAYIPMNENVFVVQDKGSAIYVKKVYNLKLGRSMTRKTLLVLPKHNLNSTSVVFMENIENVNFENMTMNAIFYLSEDYCENTPMKLALDRAECFHHEIIQMVATKLNFSTNITECQDRKFPYNYPNGTLSTLFLALENREVDIGGGSFVVSNSRLERVDFVWPTFTTRSRMYIKFKSRWHQWKAYVRPFGKYVWITILLWIVSVGLLMEIFNVFHMDDSQCRFHLLLEIFKSILLTLQIFCNQGVHDMPKWISSRLLFIMTFMLVLAVYQTYSGHLISSLMFATPQFPFTDLESYLKDRTYKLMTLKIGYHNYIFKLVLQAHNAEDLMLDVNDLPLHSKHGIKKLCAEENIAFIDFRENIVQNVLPCKLTEISQPLKYQSLGLALPKHSPYREFIQRELVSLYSSGILQRMRRLSHSYVDILQKYKSEDEYVSVSFHQVASTFVLLCAGLIFSLLILCIEMMWFGISKQIAKYKSDRLSRIRKKRYRQNIVYLKRR